MRNIHACLLALLILLGLPGSCLAQGAEAKPEGRVLQLADAYQDGYLRMTAVGCFSVYSTSGFIFGDFMNGVIDGQTAINSLEHVALLHSVALESVGEIEGLTPETDTLGREELGKLRDILEKENRLLGALLDLFSEGGVMQMEQVKAELLLVEQALDDYTRPPAE
ncbi:hypothetical protein KDL44_04010 [bacterium]|nr:hypothetical protein [bacterium]